MKFLTKIAIAATSLGMTTSALSADFLGIEDASQLKWQITSENKLYLRNIDAFGSTYLGCCYNYWIDMSTEAGKSFFAVLLAQAAAQSSIQIGVADKNVPGQIIYMGKW